MTDARMQFGLQASAPAIALPFHAPLWQSVGCQDDNNMMTVPVDMSAPTSLSLSSSGSLSAPGVTFVGRLACQIIICKNGAASTHNLHIDSGADPHLYIEALISAQGDIPGNYVITRYRERGRKVLIVAEY